jgi:SAM-dependent methyltransferase
VDGETKPRGQGWLARAKHSLQVFTTHVRCVPDSIHIFTPSIPSHRALLDRLLNTRDGRTSPHELFGEVGDEFWLWCFTDGYRSDERLRSILPAFPSDHIQCQFAGASGDDTMRDAFAFYSLVQNLVRQHGSRPLQSVLEFGCGWGRIIRFFMRDVTPHNLWGIDCMPEAIEICKESNRHCQFQLVSPLPPTGLPDATFDLVYAYSVFSHLSEAAHLAWLAEFARVLTPGGLLIATTRPREFILACAQAREAGDTRDWAQGTVKAFLHTEDAVARYDRGEFLYEPLGAGGVLDASFFGETCIPKPYVFQKWSQLLEIVDYLDSRRICVQNVIVARKTTTDP